jgi:hypothetical protein
MNIQSKTKELGASPTCFISHILVSVHSLSSRQDNFRIFESIFMGVAYRSLSPDIATVLA